MEIINFCEDYFSLNSYNTLCNYEKHDVQTNALAALTIVSYFTVIIPIGLAVAYGASLYGRVEVKKVPTEQDQKTSDIKDAVLKIVDDGVELIDLIKYDAVAFKRASTRLKQDETFMLVAINFFNVEILAHNSYMTDNHSFMQKAVAKVPMAFQYASYAETHPLIYADLTKQVLNADLKMAEYISDKCCTEALKKIFTGIAPDQIAYLKNNDFPKAKQMLAKIGF